MVAQLYRETYSSEVMIVYVKYIFHPYQDPRRPYIAEDRFFLPPRRQDVLSHD